MQHTRVDTPQTGREPPCPCPSRVNPHPPRLHPGRGRGSREGRGGRHSPREQGRGQRHLPQAERARGEDGEGGRERGWPSSDTGRRLDQAVRAQAQGPREPSGNSAGAAAQGGRVGGRGRTRDVRPESSSSCRLLPSQGPPVGSDTSRSPRPPLASLLPAPPDD